MGEWLAEGLYRLLLWLIMLPIGLALATPFILVRSLIRPGRIRSDYRAVIDFIGYLPI